jgi:inhibitor of cysteine peptidase
MIWFVDAYQGRQVIFVFSGGLTMKRTLIVFCLIFALALLLPACAGTGKTAPAGAEVKLYNESSTSIEVASGGKFEIDLAANDTTGYTWNKNEVYDKAYLELVESKYKTAEPVRPGSPGTQVYIFKALKPGATTVKMTNKRSWESTSSDKTLTFNVNIK